MGTSSVSYANQITPTGLLVRKGPKTAGNKQKFPRSERLLKALVLDAARNLFAQGDRREYSSVIASRIGISEAAVDRILTGHALAGERYRHATEVGTRNAVAMAQEAAASVWDDGEIA